MRTRCRSAWVCALLALGSADAGFVTMASAQEKLQQPVQGGGSIKPRPRPGRSGADMVITGDEEAPQVLTIIPWQEPQPKPPPEIGIRSVTPVPAQSAAPVGRAVKSDVQKGMAKPAVAKPEPAAPAVPPASVSRTTASTLPSVPIVLDSDLPIAEDPLARPLPAR